MNDKFLIFCDSCARWAVNSRWAITFTNGQPESLQSDLLEIRTKEGDLRLEPVGYKIDGRQVIEMYCWPTLCRVRFVNVPDTTDWEAQTSEGVPFHMDWNEPNFIRLCQDVLRAE